MTKAAVFIVYSLHAHSSESLPFFPGFSSPSFSYHSLQTTKIEGCSSSSWCLRLPALQVQAVSRCCRHRLGLAAAGIVIML